MRERIRFEGELSALGLAEFDTPVDGAKQKNVVLVAGFDYQSKGYRFSGAEFSEMCDRRMKLLIAKNPKLKLKFTIFDVGKGTVKTKEKNAGGKIVETLVKTFDAVSASNYDMTAAKKEKDFVSGPGVMSILDIYKYIQDLGKTEPESLIEFSIFSHGYIGGPVLVNSTVGRDDKDARASHLSNATRVAELKKAFDKNGIAWFWGCNSAKAFLIIFTELSRNSNYKKNRLKNSDVLSLDFRESKKRNAVEQKQEHDRYTEIWEFLDKAGNPPVNADNIISFNAKITFEDLKNIFILKGLEKTFSQQFAVALDVDVYGALPGTSADYEESKYKLMIVPTKKPPYADNFSPIINFYKKYLSIVTDSEGRSYAKYPF